MPTPTEIEDKLTFYLRDQPVPPPASANQPNYQGRPLVCVVAEQVDPPEPPLFPLFPEAEPAPPAELGLETEAETEEIAFWVHFCLSSCSPQDLQPQRYRRPSDLIFGKEVGRRIALTRLSKRKTVVHHSLHSPYLNEPKEWTNQVGLTVPIPQSSLSDGRVGSSIQRVILGYLADPAYQFPPTARKLAQGWFKSPASIALTSGQPVGQTEEEAVAGGWVGRTEAEQVAREFGDTAE